MNFKSWTMRIKYLLKKTKLSTLYTVKPPPKLDQSFLNPKSAMPRGLIPMSPLDQMIAIITAINSAKSSTSLGIWDSEDYK